MWLRCVVVAVVVGLIAAGYISAGVERFANPYVATGAPKLTPAQKAGQLPPVENGYVPKQLDNPDILGPDEVVPANATALLDDIEGPAPVSQDPRVKYVRASYYELPNAEFQKGIVEALSGPGKCRDRGGGAGGEVDGAALLHNTLPPAVHLAFLRMVKDVQERANREPALVVPADRDRVCNGGTVHNGFRVPYARIRYYKMLPGGLPAGGIRIQARIVLFRDGTYGGKEVVATGIVPDGPGQIQYDTAVVVGYVAGDSIGMFPVAANDPDASDEAGIRDDGVHHWTKAELDAIVQEHLKKQKRFVDASYALSSSGASAPGAAAAAAPAPGALGPIG